MNLLRLVLISLFGLLVSVSRADSLTEARQRLDQLLDVQPHTPGLVEDDAYWKLAQKTRPFLLCRQQYFFQLWHQQAVAKISRDGAALLAIQKFLTQPEGQEWASRLQGDIAMNQALSPAFYPAPHKNRALLAELPDKQPTGKARRQLQQLLDSFVPEMDSLQSSHMADMYQRCDAPLQALLDHTPAEREIAALIAPSSQPDTAPPSPQALTRFAELFAAQLPQEGKTNPPIIDCIIKRSTNEIYALATRKTMPDADTVERNTRFLNSHTQQALVKYRLRYPQQTQNWGDYLMNQASVITAGEWLLWLKYQEVTPAGQRYVSMRQLDPSKDPDMLAIFKRHEAQCSQGASP